MKPMDQKFCCQNFENRINKIGEEGFSFIPVVNDDLKYFIIQGRTITGTKILTFHTGIKYCPFCGKKLEKIVKILKEQFLELAKKYEDFI